MNSLKRFRSVVLLANNAALCKRKAAGRSYYVASRQHIRYARHHE